MKRMGIFKNNSGQDVIEYVLMALAAILIGAAIIAILKPLMLDCMIVDSC